MQKKFAWKQKTLRLLVVFLKNQVTLCPCVSEERCVIRSYMKHSLSVVRDLMSGGSTNSPFAFSRKSQGQSGN